MINMNELMKQAQKMQQNMAKAQEELAQKEFEASAGGDMVTVKLNGKLEIKSIKISKDIVDPEDIEMLEDLVLTAVNAAISKVNNENQSDIKNLTKGMNLPPGFNL